MVEGSTTRTTSFTLAEVAGNAVTTSVYIGDGRARTVSFTTDLSGQVIKRQESDNVWTQGDPSQMWFRFGGRQMGMVTNNGGWESTYKQSIDKRREVAPTGTPGAFANGAQSGISEAQFSSNLEIITSYGQGSGAGGYTVRAGDSLQSIAQNLYGDSSLWYKLAEANGLSGQSALFEGQTLRLPASVVRNTYNASTITPYNPAETLGDVNPSTPQAQPPKKNKCGAVGQILMVVIAIAVTAWLAPHMIAGMANLLSGAGTATAAGVSKLMAVGVGAVTKTLGAAAVVAGSAVTGAAASAVSQLAGMAMGVQDKFDWKAVGMAAIGGGLGATSMAANLASRLPGGATAFARGAVGSAVSQGIGVTLGLQDKFNWAAVAAAGVGGAAGARVGGKLADTTAFSSRLAMGAADAVGNAAARSLIEGSDFGDNLIAALPSVLGNAIGGYMMGAIERRAAAAGAAGELQKALPLGQKKQAGAIKGVVCSDPTVIQTSEGPVILNASEVPAQGSVVNRERVRLLGKYGAVQEWDQNDVELIYFDSGDSLFRIGLIDGSGDEMIWLTRGSQLVNQTAEYEILVNEQDLGQSWWERAQSSDPNPLGVVGRIFVPQLNDPLDATSAFYAFQNQFRAASQSDFFEQSIAQSSLSDSALNAGLRTMFPALYGGAIDQVVVGTATAPVGVIAGNGLRLVVAGRGIGAAESGLVATGRGGLSALEANAPHIAAGSRPPYAAGTRARDIVLEHDRVFVRVHGEGNQARSWMMRPHEIEGLSAQQIQDRFALPELPTYVSDVAVPAGTRIRVGTVGSQQGWGTGGGIQYELQQRLPESAFTNRRTLP